MSRSSAMVMAARALRLFGGSSRPSVLRQVQSPVDDLRCRLFSNPPPPQGFPLEIQTRSFARSRRPTPTEDVIDIKFSDSDDGDAAQFDDDDDDSEDFDDDFDFDDDDDDDDDVGSKKTTTKKRN